jgi:hypothetical protein
MYCRTGDTYVDGRFVAVAEQSQNIVASVQRLALRDRQLLPEGYRASETLKIYTEVDVVELIENDVTPLEDAAEFEYKNKRYAMIGSERWDYLVPHWKLTVVAKDG